MKKITLNQLYDNIHDHMDPTGWWIGKLFGQIILIQNTKWKKLDKALHSLYPSTDYYLKIF